MLRIWLSLTVIGVLYLLGTIWIAVAFRRLGKKMPWITKVTIWSSGTVIIYWVWRAILATIKLQ